MSGWRSSGLIPFGRRWLPAASLGVTLTAALVVGFVTPASADEPTRIAPQEQSAEAAPETITKASSAIEARLAALTQGSRVEVLSERTEYAQTFAEPDGTFTSESSTGIQWVRDEAAEDGWRAVDLTLQQGTDGVIRPASPVYGLEIHPGGEQDAPLVELTNGDESLGFAWDGEELPEPTIADNRATYSDVEPGVDLVIEATRYGFEHYMVLTEKPADPESVQVVLPIVSEGLSLEQDGDAVTVVDAEGESVGTVGRAYVWDATSDPHSPSSDPEASSDLPVADVTVEEAGGEQTLVVTPDPDFLEEATYPVTIDPSVTYGSQSDTTVGSTYPGVNFASDTLLRFGTYNSGAEKWRSYLRFAGQKIAGTQIVSATLQLYGNQSYNCTTYPFTAYPASPALANSEITWNNQPGINSSEGVTFNIGSKGGGSSCPAGWMSAANVQSIVQYFADTDRNTFSIALRASETSSTGWKKVESDNASHPPKLVVNYNRYPDTPPVPTIADVVTSGSTKYVGTLTPTFSSKTTDADGNTLTYKYQIYDANSTAAEDLVYTCTKTGVASGVTATCTVPSANKLLDNKTYWVRAGAKDSIMPASKWSGLVAFKTAAGTPPMPTISCPSPYTNGSWTGTPPTSNVTCTITVAGTGGTNASTMVSYTVDGVNTKKTAAGAQTISFPVSKAAGEHTIRTVSYSVTGHVSTKAIYSFGYGSPALTTEFDGFKTNNSIKVSAAAPPLGQAASVSAKLQWRVAGGTGSGWTDGGVVPTTGGTSGPVIVSDYVWETQAATVDSSTGTPVALNPRIPVLLEFRLCFSYSSGGPQCTDDDNVGATVLRVPHAFGGRFPTADAGLGQVALWTGELNVSQTDASVPTPDGSLMVSRSHSSFDGPIPGGYGVFGPGWTASFGGDGEGGTSFTVVDSTSVDGTIALIDGQGDPLVYRQPGGGKLDAPAGVYTAVDDDTAFMEATLRVEGAGAGRTLKLTQFGGTTTTWKIHATPDTRYRWVPVSVEQPGALGDTSYTTDGQGRVTRILAAVPDGVSCATLVAGCRAMLINYATATTATSSVPGDYAGQVKSIAYVAFDPDLSPAPGMRTTVVAAYSYYSNGRLASANDPRAPGLSTSYAYSTSGTDVTRLTSVTHAGQASYGFVYTTGADVRLARVTRGGATSGQSTSTQFSYVYGIDPTQLSTGLPDMRDSSVSRWQQERVPTYGAAAFGPDRPISTTDPSVLTEADWRYASIQYADAEGQVVNTATFGAGSWQLTATDYDGVGNPVRSFDARGIQAVINRLADGSEEFDASEYATVTRYNGATTVASEQIPPGMFATDTWTPAREAVLSNGDTRRVRVHTTYEYDQGAPTGGIDAVTEQRWGLETTTTIGVAEASSATSDPGATLPADLELISERRTGYDPIDGTDESDNTGDTSGWRLGAPTTSTVVMGGAESNDIVTKTRYDGSGSIAETRTPLSEGGDEGAHLSVDYTAGSNPLDAACGSKPEWAGLPCWTGAASAPASGDDLPDNRFTKYTYLLKPAITVETSGSGSQQVTRTTTLSYDSAGRVELEDSDTVGPDDSVPTPKTRTIYSATNGLAVERQTLDAAGQAMAVEHVEHDLWGRVVKEINELGEHTDTTYVAPGLPGAGQVATVTDEFGLVTYTYDGADANENAEYRGLVTRANVSGVGEYRAAYDDQGSLILQKAPGGVAQQYEYDSIGQLVRLSYAGKVTTVDPETSQVTVGVGTWLSWALDYDVQGRVVREWAPSSQVGGDSAHATREYFYDRAGRLTRSRDRSGADCVEREYTFDKQGNRTSITTTGVDTSGACGSGSSTQKSWSYDLSSRTLNASDGVTPYVYDSFGRITVLPAVDTPTPAAGDIALEYFDTDAPRSISQGTRTISYTLDVSGRPLVETSTSSGVVSSTVTRHYVGSSDSPAQVVAVTPQGTTTTRYTAGLGSGLGAVVNDDGSIRLTVANPQGDVVTAIPLPAGGASADAISGWESFDEYGNIQSAAASSPVDTGVVDYGWLGAHERAADQSGLVLMGARLYNPVTARFLSPDPVSGGNENAYNYPNDPVNKSDTNGLYESDAPKYTRAGVYVIFFKDGTKYIGSSVDVYRRLGEHARSTRFKNKEVQKIDIYKYKWSGNNRTENFQKLHTKEQKLLNKYGGKDAPGVHNSANPRAGVTDRYRGRPSRTIESGRFGGGTLSSLRRAAGALLRSL